MARRRCPLCGTKNGRRAQVCASCGTTLVLSSEAPELAEGAGFSDAVMGPVVWFSEVFPGLVSPKVIILSLLLIIIGAAIVQLAMFVFSVGGVLTAFAIGAAGVITYWTGITWILCGYTCLPSDGMTDFRGKQWWAFLVLGFGPFLYVFLRIGGGAG